MNLSDVQLLQIEPTSYCNARCPHCPRFNSVGELHPDLKLEHINFDKILNNLEIEKLVNLKEVILEGDKGDPAMHPCIDQLIDSFANLPNPPRIVMTTNGSIRSTGWWEKLAKKNYPTLRVIFSIDGLEDTNHLYRVGVDFNKAMSNAEAFINAGGYATWKVIAFRHNEHQIKDIELLSKEKNFHRFIVTTAHRDRFQSHQQWPVHDQGKITHYIEPPIKDYTFTIVHRPFENPLNISKTIDKTKICPNQQIGQLYITHQHYVIPCCMMHFDTQLNYVGKEKLFDLTEGFEKIDLTKNTLTEILSNNFFTKNLEESLTSNNWHPTCSKSCEKIILENLKTVKNFNLTLI